MSSLAFIGALISSPIFGYISQRYGRKIAGYLTVIPFLIGWLPIIFSELIPLYYVSRFVLGISCGAVLSFCPMYVGEISENKIRGALGTIRAGVGNLSAILICAIGPILSIRDTAIMCFITPLVFAVAFYWMPESPMFLMKSGRTKEAMEAMTWLRGGNKQNAQEEISKLALVVEESKSKQVSIKSLISSRGTRRGLGMCMLLAAAQQLSGIYPVMNYCVSLFQSAGGSVSPNTASVIMTSLQLFGSIISSILLDYLGRRISMIGSEIIMTLSLGSLGMYFYLQKLDFDLTYVGFLPMLCIALYVLAHSIGIGSVTYVIMSEIFNPEARGLATSITTVTAWGLSFMATKLYPTAVFYLGLYGCYWLFSFVCILFTIYIFFKIPETKNRSLDSILRELNDESSKQTDIEVKNKSTKENIPERY
ncbi:hypothetical protein L9F63_017388 [Diploptera punctata]|uniref:Major facilitator superfamily (MFS) profile domain-containing protein n=1 Tax=Diploptera punctata TaxID=6984 RepID=A0AAD8EGT9_DIPPU|nr:hypothetical protein L9F63_017388 [Diploptera punctata]